MVYYNEYDKHAADWIRQLIEWRLIPNGEVDTRDIRDVRPTDLRGFVQCHFFAGIGGWAYALQLTGWPEDRPIWTASCPCQPFSSSGKGAGFDDERHLWPDLFWLIRHGKPRTTPIFGEQVASQDGLTWFDLVQADMEGEGYACQAFDLPAASVGAPHIRQRLYWCAHTEHGSGSSEQWIKPGKRQAEGPEQISMLGRDSNIHGSADSSDVGRRTGRQSQSGDESDQQGVAPIGKCGPTDAESRGSSVRSGDTNGKRRRPKLSEYQGDERTFKASGCDVDGSGDTDSQRRIGIEISIQQGQPRESRIETSGQCPDDGAIPWRQPVWLPCRDMLNGVHPYRPTEPEVFGLADGISDLLGFGGNCLSPLIEKAEARSVRLRGYGNAIVPQLAAEFIGAYMDVCGIARREVA